MTFILGMIVGIILFVVGIGGAVYALATATTIGQLQDTAGIEIIDGNSDIIDKTIWDAVTEIMEDVQNIDKLTINDLITKYGLPIPTELSGVDITSVFDIPILQIPDNLDLVINSVTLTEIGSLIGVDFSTYDIPIIKDNLNNNIKSAMNNILAFIEDADTMTLRGLEENFGISLGNTELLSEFKDLPLNQFESVISAIEIGVLLSVDRDLFVENGNNPVYVKTDLYEEVDETEYASLKAGAKTYLAGADNNKKSVYKELRFIKKTTVDEEGNTVETFVVDNSSNAENFAPTEETPKFYRLIEYSLYDASTEYPAETVFYVPAVINSFKNAENKIAPETDGFIALDKIYSSEDLSVTYNSLVNGADIDITSAWYSDGEETPSAVAAEKFGLNPEELASEKSRLQEGFEGYFRVYAGTSDAIIQTLASVTVDGLNNVTDTLMDIKLGELLPSDGTTSQLFDQLSGKTLRELTEQGFDEFTISDIMDVREGAYVNDANGVYVFVPQAGAYKLYNSDVHSGMTRYSMSYTEISDGGYVLFDGTYYLYKAYDERFEGLARYEKTYAPDSEGDYVYIENNGYYTLYNPSLHSGAQRYSLISGYAAATDDEITAGTNLFFWNGSSMQAYTGAESGPLYVNDEPSAKIIRRLSNVPLTSLSDAINNLVLGDAVDIDVDIYSYVTTGYADTSLFDAAVDYYYFDNGIYKLAYVFDDAFKTAHPDEAIYEITRKGADNSIMKKLTLLKIDEFASRVDEVIDELYLSDVMDISIDAYVENSDGAYVYIAAGGYYTLYDAANHAYATLTRYDRVNGYRIASDEEIAADTGLYFYDYTLLSMNPYDASMGDKGTLYVSGEASNKILQRFSKVKISGFSDAMDNLLLGEIFDLDGDIYRSVDADYVAANPDAAYYTYENGLYKTAADHSDSSQTYYIKVKNGTSNVILKRLALLSLDGMSSRMTEVINDTYLSELIEIVSYASAREFASGDNESDAKWIVAPSYEYSQQQSDGAIDRFAFVYDNDGGYYRAAATYLEATDKQLAVSGAGTYSYVCIGDLTDYEKAALLASNPDIYQYLFYKADGSSEYVFRPALNAYLISKNDFSKLYYRNSSGTDYSFDKYYGHSLYVNILGVYIAYDAANPAMSDMIKYYKYENGYYPASADNIANGDVIYYFDYTTGSYVGAYTEGNCFDMRFIKINADGSGNYYYTKIDSYYTDGTAKFAKQYCETLYVEDAAGGYVYYDNSYTAYSAPNPEHAALTRYNKAIGYMASYDEVSASGTLDALSSDKIIVTREKSANVLKAFKNKNASIGNMNGVLNSLSLGELLTIEPDSLFDDEAVKTATLNNFSARIQTKFSNMNMGEIMELSGVSGVSPAIVAILKDVSIHDFFTSLTFDETKGSIYIDMEKLYA